MDVFKACSPPWVPGNPDSPLYILTHNSFPTNSVDLELRIAEAKEKMKQMMHESHDICRELNFDSEDALELEKEINLNLEPISKKSTVGCLREERQDEYNLSMISSDELITEEDYFSYLKSKFFPVELATQASAPQFHEEGDDTKPGFIKNAEGLLIDEGDKEFSETVSENKQQRIIHHEDDHDDFKEKATCLDVSGRTATLKDNVSKLSHQVQVLMNQLAGCRRNLLTAEREVKLLCEENRELRDLIHDLLLVHGQKLKRGLSHRA